MKKVILVLMIVALAFTMVGCSTNSAGAEETPEAVEPSIEGTLEEIMAEIYLGVDQEYPAMMTTVVDDTNVAYFLGTDEVSYMEALASEPMMSSFAHSTVLLRVDAETDVDALMESIKTNVDPRKWICVGVEEDQVIVDRVGDLVILIMDHEAEALHEHFLSLAV
jgi:PBP1b-binding outer membrane lipoprotein LpoB